VTAAWLQHRMAVLFLLDDLHPVTADLACLGEQAS
jgi:hypothetical protein